MTPTAELAKLVLKQNEETQAQQERLIALVALHHDELDQLSRVLPELKREALDNINARLEGVVAEATAKTAAAVDSQATQFAASAELKMQPIAPMLAAMQATRDEINALLAQLDQRHTESLTSLARALSGIAEKKAREMLASDENKETIRAAFAEHSKPILAALESKGGSFIDLYQGEFAPIQSKAKRGQIWTYYGNTLLCTKDTDLAPQYLDTSETWAMLAAKGAPGAAGTGGGTGGGIDDAPSDGTPYARQDAAWVSATPSGVTLSQLADLAQDQFIGRTTASTGTPETATITAAARTVLDDANVAAMVNTLGGATSTGTGGLVREGSPTLSGTVTLSGSGGATLDNSSASDGAISSTGGGKFVVSAPIKITGAVTDSANSAGTADFALVSNGSGVLTYKQVRRNVDVAHMVYTQSTTAGTPSATAAFFGGNNRSMKAFDSTGYTQARVKCHVAATAANATTSVFVRYHTASSATFADFAVAGASSTEISVTLSTAQNTTFVGSWVNLTSGAIGDKFWVIGYVDSAAGGLTPTWAQVSVEYR